MLEPVYELIKCRKRGANESLMILPRFSWSRNSVREFLSWECNNSFFFAIVLGHVCYFAHCDNSLWVYNERYICFLKLYAHLEPPFYHHYNIQYYVLSRPVYQKTAPCARRNCRLPSSTIFRKIISILENKEYMAMMKEKLLEIKRFYKNLKLTPMVAGRC